MTARERATLEDTMFFTRLRRHAKWMFVFLALVFGLGFVVFGIGSDTGTGIGDILRDQGNTPGDVISVSEARERVAASPKNPAALRDLATALQDDGEAAEAITVLTRYVDLRPRDQDALRELAGLHLAKATAEARRAQEAQERAQYLTFGVVGAPRDLGDGATLGADPIIQAVATHAGQQVSEAYAAAQGSFLKAEQTYDKLVATAPDDPNIQLELAQAAQQSGNTDKAITAYERFLELAPDDPSASIVRQQIAQLKASRTSTQTTVPPG